MDKINKNKINAENDLIKQTQNTMNTFIDDYSKNKNIFEEEKEDDLDQENEDIIAEKIEEENYANNIKLE